MAEITPRRSLNTYEDDINAFSYEYRDESQKFYFFIQYANGKPAVVENCVRLRPPTYDVLISRIGQAHPETSQIGPVADIQEVKNNIVEYFKSHSLGVADNPPDRVVFE
jgi:hypothetical protein